VIGYFQFFFVDPANRCPTLQNFPGFAPLSLPSQNRQWQWPRPHKICSGKPIYRVFAKLAETQKP
jgi:hypothetical protein